MFSVWKFLHKDFEIPGWAMLATALSVLLTVTIIKGCDLADAANVLSTENGKTSVELSGRVVSCPIARYKIPAQIYAAKSSSDTGGGEAASGGTGIWLNYPMLKKTPPVVQWFIFYHECGHLQIDGGGTELRADTWATKFGVEQGWLKTEEDLQHVCDSWEGAPAIGVHPAASTRCAHVKKWMGIYTERQIAAANPADIGEAEKPLPEAKKTSRIWASLRWFWWHL